MSAPETHWTASYGLALAGMGPLFERALEGQLRSDALEACWKAGEHVGRCACSHVSTTVWLAGAQPVRVSL